MILEYLVSFFLTFSFGLIYCDEKIPDEYKRTIRANAVNIEIDTRKPIWKQIDEKTPSWDEHSYLRRNGLLDKKPIIKKMFVNGEHIEVDITKPLWQEIDKKTTSWDQMSEARRHKKPFKKKIKNNIEPLEQFSLNQTLQFFISENKEKLLIVSSLFLIYGYFSLKLYQSKKYINKTITWSWFKKNVPLDVLYEIPEDKLLNELMEVIYRTFSEDEDNPNYDDIEPLYLFIKAAHKEIKLLESFINLYWYLKLPIISLIFPNLDDELILAQEKIEKLSYMQDLVTNKICAMNS